MPRITVRDEFHQVSFGNNDGPDDWTADWIENDPEKGGAGPSAGQVQVAGGALRLDDQPDTGGFPSAQREVDLAGAVSATFSFDYHTTSGVDTSDVVQVKVSADGGANWTVLDTITGIKGSSSGSRSYDITAYVSSQTRVKFRILSYYGAGDEFFFADNVEITTDCGGCVSDAECDDGQFCNGEETCDLGSGECQAGTAPDCDDGEECTVDSCDEEADMCVNDDSGCPSGGCPCTSSQSWIDAGIPDLSATFNAVFANPHPTVPCATTNDGLYWQQEGDPANPATLDTVIWVDTDTVPKMAPPFNLTTSGGPNAMSCGVANLDFGPLGIVGSSVDADYGQLTLTAAEAATCFALLDASTCNLGGAGN